MRSITALLFLLFGTHVLAMELSDETTGWELEFEKDGLAIFTREHPGSEYHAFKAETILDAPIHAVMAVMSNPGSCVEWVHGCVESFGVREESFNRRYAYSRNDLPWPVQDRDYVIRIETDSNPETGVIEMHMRAVDDPLRIKDDLIRVTNQQTHYYFVPVDETKTRMTWIQHTEPAGRLPSWLVNALIVDIPFKSMKMLEKVARSARYMDSSIEYNGRGVISGVRIQEQPGDAR